MIEVEGLSKSYRFGQIGAKTLQEEFSNIWRRIGFRNSDGLDQEEEKNRSNKLFWALRDVSFTLEQGEILGLIGKNGAGKSTLLKILSRITEPTQGEARLLGRVSSLLEVGTGFHPDLTGRENAYLNGAILGMTKDEVSRKFDEIVEFSEVGPFIDTPVKRYSSGMYVRLAFAIAAHLEPDILLVDEVLAVGDIAFQKKCLGKIGEISRGEGRTIIFVSHNLSSIKSLCSRVLLLDEGKLICDSDPTKAIQEYHNRLLKKEGVDLKTEGTRFEEVYLCDENNERLQLVHGEKRVLLNFEIVVEKSNSLNLGFTVFNDEDIGIFSSCALDSMNEIPVGRHTLQLPLPTEILPSGSYRVEGALWDPYKVHHQSDHLSAFNVVAENTLEIKGFKPKGLVLLRADWRHKERTSG